MKLQLNKEFLAGSYRSTAEKLLGQKITAAKNGDFVSLIAALSFLGRTDEAQSLFEQNRKKFSGLTILASRFFLAIGLVRRSEYEAARKIFAENEKLAGKSALEQFYVQQGNVLYFYYTGQTGAALKAADLALTAAVGASDLFARALATDALGHCNVVGGEIHKGLAQLAEAAKLMAKLGNKSFANGFAISRELYEAEFGLTGDAGLKKLEERLNSTGTEDNYSFSNVAIELARQYTLRGRFSDSRRVLELAAPLVYANQHRRHEILLNLRLAELSGRQGEFFQSKHFLWFARHLLNREADASFELAALGIEYKLALAEGKKEAIAELSQRWKTLGASHANTRDRNLRARLDNTQSGNPEDKVYAAFFQSAQGKNLESRLAPLLENGFLAEVSRVLELQPGIPTIAVLAHGILIQSKEKISWREGALSSLQYKILRVLGRQEHETSKENLVQLVWGYNYDALRHDSMVYAALSSLRKALDSAGAWVVASEGGYRLEAKLCWKMTSSESAAVQSAARPELPAENLLQLNHRQIEILEWMRNDRYLGVADCKSKFGVSEITALRDLDGLRRKNFVVRIGKARATRYLLGSKGDLQ
ncbi:MAG: hypothetical protein ACXWQO_05845 [Bdellovibrionota bacterium]